MSEMKFAILSLAALLTISCGNNSQPGSSANDSTNADGAIDTAALKTVKNAFIFSLPTALLDITRRKMTDANSQDAAAENVFFHKSSFPDASFRDVVRPNADTYYSTAVLDLSNGPLVLSLPNTHGRYYMMPILDAYSNVFASPGTRTTGNGANIFLITGPGWSGTVPTTMKEIKSPTHMAFIIGRTQVNSKADGQRVVVPLQRQYKLVPLSAWGKPYRSPKPIADPTVPKGTPNDIVKNMPIDSFFNYVNRLFVKNPPLPDDKTAMEEFASIGVGPGKQFDLNKFNAATQQAIKKIPGDFFALAAEYFSKPKELVNGWNPMHGPVGTYGTNYNVRAMVAYGGLFANLTDDAIYPSAGFDGDNNPLNGANNYVIHFNKGETPPANAFWSITMYDGDGFMVDNPIKRNAIGDRSNLKKNADGSIDIYIQHDSPGSGKEQNWLPAPIGPFNVLMRVYWPKKEMLDGSWHAPALKKQ